MSAGKKQITSNTKTMKQALLSIILAGMILMPSVYAGAQNFTGTWSSAPLSEVLDEIESRTGYHFIFENKEINTGIPVTATFTGAEITDVLDKILGPSMHYTIKGKYITVSKRQIERAPLPSKDIRHVSGTVISSADNQPVAGAGVYVAGTSSGTVTDLDGNWSLELPPAAEKVTFECIGYETLILNVERLANMRIVTMNECVNTLEDVVVVGFGTQKRESLVGAVQAVKPNELKSTTSNLSTSFAGKIAGVISVQSSGEPGVADGASFWIRGVSTFGSGQSPLYIVDGVEITAQMLNNIPPETIESFSILKDATATSLYGSRGANGVMIITTKSGRNSERMAINVRAEAGISGATAIPEAADAITFMETFNEALVTRGKEPYYSEDKISGTRTGLNPYVYPDVDWYKMLFKDMTVNQNFNINMTGGGKKVDYFLNVSAYNENGILRKPDFSGFNTNINSQKYLFQANINALMTPTTKVSLKMNTQLHFQHTPVTPTRTLFQYCLQAMPCEFAPVLPAEEDDTFVRFGTAPRWTTGYCTNPYAELCKGYSDQYRGHFTSALSVNQDLKFITKGLSAYALVTFYNRVYSAVSHSMTPFLYRVHDWSVDENGNYLLEMIQTQQGSTYLDTQRSNDGLRELSFQAKIDYNRTFRKHTVGATIVYHQKEQMKNVAAAVEYASLPYREQGLAGRVTYDFDKRYLIEANFGYNGSENFARGKRFGFFPSIAGGWVISNEPYWSGLKNTVNLLKIRASYGLVGNDVISSSYSDRFPYLSTVDMNTGYNIALGPNLSVQSGPSISTYGNPSATWETSRKVDIGLEFGLFRELNLIVDYFYEKRSGIFMQRQSLPSSFGLSGITPWGNIGKVDNSGVDASIDYNKVFSKDFILSLRGTFTYAHNEIKFMDEPIYEFDYQKKTGHSINSVYLYVFDRYFTDEEDIRNSPDQSSLATLYPLLPGDIKYKDLNNDGKIDDNDQMWIDRTTIPEITYGFGFSIQYRSFDISAFFQGTGRMHLLMTDNHPFSTATDPGSGLMMYHAKDHWSESKPDPDAAYPRLSDRWNVNNTVNSTLYLKNAAFLRLKTAEIGYTWKEIGLRAYISGTNLLTFSGFKYWDPEKGSGNGLSYPLQRTVNIGLQFNY